MRQSGHTVELDDKSRQIVIRHANGPVITLTAGGEIKLEATTVSVTAVSLDVHAPTATFDGIVNCKTMNASVSVSSPLYSIGVGNRSEPPHMVAIQEKILTPVGTAITMVAAVK